MNQVERIKLYETYYDESKKAINELNDALDNYLSIDKHYQKLVDYYTSSKWMKDYEDDEKGKLPKNLKRGILSEDSVYDLIIEHKEIIKKLMKIINSEIETL